ncbi:MAG: hypothetical protein JSW50_09900 [Candidatus Latescibacterota bacterium]|nr:MAG: hypothetical protein JSW50_09900 [Candidatus Latescibacterota bacterium]
MNATAKKLMIIAVAAATLAVVSVGTSNAGFHVGFTYSSSPANVQVWLGSAYDYDVYYDDGYGYDVYPSEADVVLYVRPSRSCFTTVYVVDTEGFVHIVHPLSPAHDAYLRGGRVYRYRLRDVGFYEPCFNRGVAYAFAVTSPVPFDYGYYGVGVFGPRIGFRIYGDPFVASRLFYISILPPGCHRSVIAVGHARFYVREYRPYPVYLCAGWHYHHHKRVYCRGNCAAHRQFRVHAADPYRVINPRRELRDRANDARRYTKIDRTVSKDIRDIRTASRDHRRTRQVAPVDRRVERRSKPIVGSSRPAQRVDSGKVLRGVRTTRVGHQKTADGGRTSVAASRRNADNSRAIKNQVSPKQARATHPSSDRVVLSTRAGFIKSKNEFSKMREKLADKKTNGRGVKKSAPKQTKVTRRNGIERTKVAKSGDPKRTGAPKKDKPVVREDSQRDRTVAHNSTQSRKATRAKRTKK